MAFTTHPPLLSPVRFNVNWTVIVRLTPRGRSIRAAKEHTFPKEDADGRSIWQLWELMHVFGPYLYNGCSAPFETEIILLPDPYTVIQSQHDASNL